MKSRFDINDKYDNNNEKKMLRRWNGIQRSTSSSSLLSISIRISIIICTALICIQQSTDAFYTTNSYNSLTVQSLRGFAVPSVHSIIGRRLHAKHTIAPLRATRSDDEHFLLNEFKTASGELIDPYKILKVSRKSSRDQIRKAYLDLSRRYHPDGVRQRDLLPGSCNNLDEVREHWERVKLAYEILSVKKMRIKYDRNEALANPGGAMKRAAVNAAFDGIKGVGKGIFGVGAFAVNKMTSPRDKGSEPKEQITE